MKKEESKRNKKKKILWRITLFSGIALIIAAVGMFVWCQIDANQNEENLREYVALINEAVSEKQNAVLEEKSDNMMPVMSIKRKDFIGLLEFQSNNRILPVCAKWENIDAYPCRFEGSIYDGSIIIGATDQKGQIDFIDNILVSDKVTFTDMLGDCYSYKVMNIRFSDNAEYGNLTKGDYDLTIFIKKTYSSDYIIINCIAAGTI